MGSPLPLAHRVRAPPWWPLRTLAVPKPIPSGPSRASTTETGRHWPQAIAATTQKLPGHLWNVSRAPHKSTRGPWLHRTDTLLGGGRRTVRNSATSFRAAFHGSGVQRLDPPIGDMNIPALHVTHFVLFT